MDLCVELADGTLKSLQVQRSCTIEGAMKLIIQLTGLESVADKLAEFSLALQNENSDAWINVSWLDPATSLGDQGITRSTTLLFRKKYFGQNSDLHSLDSSEPLLRNIYAQLQHTFAAGLYQCSTFQVAQIAALAVKVEMSGTNLTLGSLQKSCCLEWILPAKFSTTPGIDQIVLKAAKNIEHFSVEEAQRAFVQRLQKLETFGLVFYTATYNERGKRFEGLLGIGAENLFKIDKEEMEIISQWEIADLRDYHCNNTFFTLVFPNQEVTMATQYGHLIHSYLSGIVPAKSEPAVSSGSSRSESKSPIDGNEVGDIRKKPQLKSPPPKVLPKPPSKAPKPIVLPKPDTRQPMSIENGIKSPTKLQSPKHTHPPSPVKKQPPGISKPKPMRPRASTSPASSLKDKRPGQSDKPTSPKGLQQLGSLIEEQSSDSRLSSSQEQPLSPTRFQSPISPIRYTKPKTSWQELPISPVRLQKGPVSTTTVTTETSRQKATRKAKKPLEVPQRLRKEQERPEQVHSGVSSPSSTSPEPEDYLTPVPSPNNRIPDQVYSDVEFQDERGSLSSIPQQTHEGTRRQSAPAQLLSSQYQTPQPGPAGVSILEEEEQIYDTVCDDLEEVSQILGSSHDLAREVEFSRDKNPLYDTAAASEAQTLLRNSNVTFKALNRSFKKNQSTGRSLLSSTSSDTGVRAERGSPLVNGIERQQEPLQKKQAKHPGKRTPLLPPKPGKASSTSSLSSLSSEPSSPRSPVITKLDTAMEMEGSSRAMYEGAVELMRHPPPPPIPKKPAAKQRDSIEYSDPIELRRASPSGGKISAAQQSRSPGITKVGVASMSEYTYAGVYGGAGEVRKVRPPSKQPQPLGAAPAIPKSPAIPPKEKRNSTSISPPGITRLSVAAEMTYHDYEDIDEDDDPSEAPVADPLPPPPVPKQPIAPSKRHSAAIALTGQGVTRFGARANANNYTKMGKDISHPPAREIIQSPPPIPPKDKRLSAAIKPAEMTKLGVATEMDDYEDIETHPPPPIAKQPKNPPRTNRAVSTAGITKLGVAEMDEDYDDIFEGSSQRDTQPLLPGSNVKRQPQLSPSPVTKRYSAAGSRSPITRISVVSEPVASEELYTNPEEMYSPNVKQQPQPSAPKSRSPINRISVVNDPMESEELYTNPEEMYSPNTKRRPLPSAAKSRSPINRISVVNDPMESEELYTNPEEMYSPNIRKRIQSSSGTSTESADELHQGESVGAKGVVGGRGVNGQVQKLDLRPPKPPRGWKTRKVGEESQGVKSKQPPKPVKQGETLKANLNATVQKLISQICALLGAKDPNEYSLFVEGAVLTSLKEKGQLDASVDDENAPEEQQPLLVKNGKKPQHKSATAALEHFTFLRSFTILPDQGLEPIQLSPGLSFREHGITTARILALRPKPACTEKLPRGPVRVPDWVKFHQCWLSIVQGLQACSLQDAVGLAALQYQAYFLDRIEPQSVIAFCKSSDFLPLEYASVRGMEDKVFQEQQSLKGYTQKQAQDSYIHTCGSLPTYATAFFPCKELKKRVFQNSKLTPILIGINQEGILRVDTKTKEVLDMWPYQVVRNWGHSKGTFVLDFVDSSYPVKTNQGKWMNELVNFHLEAILRGNLPVPPSHTVVPAPPSQHRLRKDDFSLSLDQHLYNKADVEQIYEELLSPAHQRSSPKARSRQLHVSNSSNSGSSQSPSPAPMHTPTPPHSASRPFYNLPEATEEAIYEVPADDIVPLVPASNSSHYQDDDIYDTPEAVLHN